MFPVRGMFGHGYTNQTSGYGSSAGYQQQGVMFPDMTGGYGGNQMASGYGGNQMASGYGGNQMASGYGGNQMASGYGGSQMAGGYGSGQMAGNWGSYGGSQMAGNYGGSQTTGNYGGSQTTGNYGGSQMTGSYGGSQMQMSVNSMSFPQQSRLRSDWNMNAPQRGVNVPNRGYAARGGQKRHVDNSTSYPSKRARSDTYVSYEQARLDYKETSGQTSYEPSKSDSIEETSSTSSSPQYLPTGVKNKFLVPISHGTEKITMDIWNYFLHAKMEEEDFKKKLKLRKCLLTVVRAAFPNCSLFIVGSSMTGFATKTSDVDMCLMISESEIDQKRDAAIILNSISQALRQCTALESRQVIRAKVPILKFVDSIAGVECDLNVNNLIGVRNTHLVRFYAYMDWRVRPLMLFIKRWARYHDINDASKQTISSYSLTLMLIHYLQVGVTPPVLPCLQKLRPDLFHFKRNVRQLSLKFDDDVDFTSENRTTLGELFLGFLNYYANIFSFNDQVISVRLGKTLSFQEVSSGGNMLQWKHLNIEEPFEKTNTARSVYDKYVFMRVFRVFQNSYHTLEKSRDIEDIFVRPF